MKPKNPLRSFLLLAGSTLLAIPAVHAATLTWDHNTDGTASDGGGTWLNANQWLNGGLPANWSNGPADNAIIGSGGTGGTITLGAVSAGTVSINNFGGTYTLSGTSLDQTGGITVGSTAGAVTINSIISGAGGLTMAGTGRLTLSNAANSYSGQLSIENGELFRQGAINNNNANGVFGNSALPLILGASGTTGRLSILNDGGLSTNKGFTLATGGTGQVQFGNLGAFQITNANRPLTLSGSIGGSGNFVKLGGATVILSGNNDYSGTTTVNEGQLQLSSATALPGGIAETGGTSALTIHGNGNINVGATIGLTSTSGDFKRGLGTGVTQFQIPGGISGFDAFGSVRQVIVNNDPAFELQWGIPTFNPSQLLFGYHPQTGTAAVTLQNKIDLNGATRTITVNSNTATLSGDIRTSSGTAGLTKTGAGTLVLSGANTYNGPTTINDGTLTISNATTFTNSSEIDLNGATTRLEVAVANQSLAKLVAGGGVPSNSFLRYSSQVQTAAGPANGPGTILGTVELNLTNVNPDYTLDFGNGSTFQNLVTTTYTSPITLSGDASINSSAQVFTLNSGGITVSTAGAKTLTLTGSNAGANTINSVIGNGSGTMAVTKTGGGSWTLAGANPYSGATTVSAGTLTLGGADGSIGSSAVTVAGGTLTVSNTGAANHGNRLSNSLALTMNGGTFNFNNSAGAFDYSESAGTLTLVGGANTVAIQQAAVGQTSTLTFAGLSRTVGAMNFSGVGLGTAVDPRSKITFTSAPTLTNGIIGPWATVNGTTYATLIGNDVVAYNGVLTDVTRQSSGDKVIPDSATADVRIIEGTGGAPANLTLAATTTTINTLLHSTGTGATTIDIASGQTLGVNSINMVPSAGALTLGIAANTGTLMPATAGGNLLLVNSSNNIMTINSVIADNASASSITKDGSGRLNFFGNNTHTGGTVINGGSVGVNGALDPFGSAGSTVSVNGSFNLVNTGSGATTFNRPFELNNNAVVNFTNGNSAYTITGAVTGSGGVAPQTAGGIEQRTLSLTSLANDFSGPIILNWDGGNNATLSVNSLGDAPGAGAINLFASTAGEFMWGSGAATPLLLDHRQFVIASNSASATLFIKNANTASASANTITINTDLLVTGIGNKTLRLDGNNTGLNTFAGQIADGPSGAVSLLKNGNGTWRLAGDNTYSGQTTIGDGQGTLIFQNASQSVSASSKLWIGGSAGMTLLDDDSGTISLGNNVDVGVAGTGERDGPTIFVGNNGGATTGSTIALGTFDLTFGDARSTQILRIRGADGYRLQLGGLILAKRADNNNPQIEPTTAPVTIAGPVIQASGKLATDSTPSDTLDLIGTATGNLISGVIQNAADFPSNPNAKPLNIRKSGAGEWIFTGANTYTGTTAVTAGTLLVNNPGSLDPASAVSVTGSATLGGDGTIGGNVTVAATANLAPGASAGTLSIGGDLDISALAGGAGKLNFELGANNALSSDRIAVTGGLDIGLGTLGLSDFNLSNLGGLQDGTYTLLSSSGLTGSLDGADVDDVGTIFPGATIQLQTSGDNIVLAVSGLGGGTAYQTWATGNEPFDGDANGDGVTDGLAFLLGAVNPSENAIGRLPTVTQSGGDLILTFNCLPTTARGTAVLKVEHSNTLASWTATTNAVPDASGPDAGGVVSYVVGAGPVGPPALNTVTATIDSAAAAAGKLFGRLQATE